MQLVDGLLKTGLPLSRNHCWPHGRKTRTGSLPDDPICTRECILGNSLTVKIMLKWNCATRDYVIWYLDLFAAQRRREEELPIALVGTARSDRCRYISKAGHCGSPDCSR